MPQGRSQSHPKEYTVECTCTNCGKDQKVTLPYGHMITAALCSGCGCRTLQRRWTAKWDRPKHWSSGHGDAIVKMFADGVLKGVFKKVVP